MQSREDKKRQTRKSLMDAALTLTGNGENFSNISLREVAKNAGVVPTSFYRHFKDMEELGLNIVDDLGLILRKLMRATRQNSDYFDTLAQQSIEVYTDFVSENKNYFYFMAQIRTGGTPVLRNAIRSDIKYFANELASDLRPLSVFDKADDSDLELISLLIVEAVFDTTIDLLDQIQTSPNQQQAYVDNTVKKLRMIWLGAITWQS
jgi:TetR/AcrR family transcriptional regulator, fatty acid biosynthesis regulator